MTKKSPSYWQSLVTPSRPLVVNFWLRACRERAYGGIDTPSKSATVSEVAVRWRNEATTGCRLVVVVDMSSRIFVIACENVADEWQVKLTHTGVIYG